ncbi:tetratricopeptide repeat protein [Pedobacter sp. B4-66]|uniref:tetratricopeptide repeat protein n=1 Tax=Pedobacter sp. B4-66 TaxID=2817280 RepID=UPI001BDAF6CD|nr:tetratricopeptide repeat protein [Pedobacter sp. B4-66]
MKPFSLSKLCSIFFFVAITFLCKQGDAAVKPDEQFNEIYVKIATEVSSSNLNRAFKMSDSLLASTSDKFQKMKCLMLLATLNQRSGNIVKAIEFVIKAGGMLSEDEKYLSWKVRIPGLLSTLYRSANLTEEARKYLVIAEKENLKLKPSTGTTITQALILQEKAYYAIEEDQNYKLALEELSESERMFLKGPNQPSRDVFLGTNYQLIGLCYLKIKDYEKAKAYYLKAKANLSTTESELKAYIFCGLGDLSLEMHQYKEALSYFEKAEPYANNSNNFHAKIMINRSFAIYYKKIGDTKSALKYHELYSVLMDRQAQATKEVSNQLFKQVAVKEKESSTITKRLILISVILIGFIVFLLYLNNRSNKKNRIKYEKIIKVINSVQGSNEQENLPIEINDPNSKLQSQSMMTNESEKRLLDSLNKLESKNFFLRGDVSLSSVASKLNSNTKYVSYIINKYKGKDFNNYINELRILYALNDLRSNADVRKYKISYLADKYGFSSHSKFAAIFKSTAGISPSIFINNLKKDDNIVSVERPDSDLM